MPQLRQNIITGEWVVIAPERAKRPSDFILAADTTEKSTANCPFCPESESHKIRLTEYDTPSTYIIPNKFPAFAPSGEHEVRSYTPTEGFYMAKPAVGGHDVIVVNEHHTRLTQFNQTIMTDLLATIQRRYQYYREQRDVEYVMGIYNHGEGAAASVNHPHAQIFASSIIPNTIIKEKQGSERYYELTGRCVFCEMIEHEKKEAVRVVAENDNFIAFTFFAARLPFEIWILPKTHQSMFETLLADQISSLAELFRQTLGLLDTTLHDPALNFSIHSLPTTSEDAKYFHWHLEIGPRISKYGGYEMGSGTIIDVVSPEKAAEFLLGKEQAEASGQK